MHPIIQHPGLPAWVGVFGLQQACPESGRAQQGVGATPIVSPGSRFGESDSLYRLSGNDSGSSKGHGGHMSEGCQRNNGQGTVLSRTVADRKLPCKEDNKCDGRLNGENVIIAPAGTEVSCSLCHDNKILNRIPWSRHREVP